MVNEEPIRSAVVAMLKAIGDDPSREGLKNTPQRVSRMYADLFSGIGIDPHSALDAIFEEEECREEMVIVRDVPFFSMCEHHLLPFFGHAHMGYIPDGKIAGASKLIRTLEVVTHRPQIQERMTGQVADVIQDVLAPDGAAVVIEAEHLCMSMRGVKKGGSLIVTSATRGSFDKRGISRSELIASLQRSVK